MTYETADALGVAGEHRVKLIEPLKQFSLGGWKVLPFDTVHDCLGSVGFLMDNGKNRILFATDTAYLRYRFSNITHLLIECNYQQKLLEKNIQEGMVDQTRKRRLLRSHFSLENLVQMLQANDWSRLQECWLIHLSKQNADEEYMKRTVQGILGKPVHIAKDK